MVSPLPSTWRPHRGRTSACQCQLLSWPFDRGSGASLKQAGTDAGRIPHPGRLKHIKQKHYYNVVASRNKTVWQTLKKESDFDKLPSWDFSFRILTS